VDPGPFVSGVQHVLQPWQYGLGGRADPAEDVGGLVVPVAVEQALQPWDGVGGVASYGDRLADERLVDQAQAPAAIDHTRHGGQAVSPGIRPEKIHTP
jgi:hypothetical protein